MSKIEPVAWMHVGTLPGWEALPYSVVSFYERYNEYKTHAPLYSASALAAARRDALEEAIGALHELYAALPADRPTLLQEIAAIRALIEKEND